VREPAREEWWLVAGLGNPGPRYAGNRHNAGHMVAGALARRAGASLRRDARRRVLAGTGELAGHRVVIAEPIAFMNLSGGPVAALASFHKIPPGRVVIIHDELDLPFGAVRLKLGGGDNGHNGLRSVSAALGTREYNRVRIGIGRPPARTDPADYVLSDFTAAERKDLPFVIELAADAVEALLARGLVAAQNQIHPARAAGPA